jgi:hypothetical protein
MTHVHDVCIQHLLILLSMPRDLLEGGGLFGFGFGEWVCTLWESWEWEEG